jgi:hypothetical protein
MFNAIANGQGAESSARFHTPDLVNGGDESAIFLDILYRLFTDLNCKPFAG